MSLDQRCEERRLSVLASLDPAERTRLGQHFTPGPAASLIAGLPRLPQSGRLRILDPGAGSGSLTAAIVSRVISECPELELDIIGVEIDPAVATSLNETFADCEVAARSAGVKVSTQVIIDDIIDLATSIDRHVTLGEFDLVIMNPPYRKLGRSSRERYAVSLLGAECPNLYAAFLAVALEALRPYGQLVAITPRSFANGTYFDQFRRFLLDRLTLDRIHIFESRSKVFADTDVLQENVIVSGTRDGQQEKVIISVSDGHADQPIERVVEYDGVVQPGDRHRFIRIAAQDTDSLVSDAIHSLPCILADLGLKLSTGRVVDFRSKPNLRDNPAATSVPLIYPGNVRAGRVEWPRPICKPQAFEVLADRDNKLLLPPGEYVVVKRFSAKEERRRVVAAVWEETTFPGPVAFENHLNVYHAAGRGLDPFIARGMSMWLNSSLVDQYFRIFSGHTQVNATDLRSLRYPSLAALRRLGTGTSQALPPQAEIDSLVTEAVFSGQADDD